MVSHEFSIPSDLGRLSRRLFLRRGAATGAVLALPAFMAACGTNDQDVFAQAPTTDATTDTAPSGSSEVATTAPVPTVDDSPTTTPAVDDDPTTAPAVVEATPTPEPTPTVEMLPQPLAIDFVYTMGSGGKPLNPYLAVWVEDTQGNLLTTVALWHEQTSKGPNWLDDLRNWWRADQARLRGGDGTPVTSSATRSPGSQSLLWDGLDQQGNEAPDSVVICIESARERGPHSMSCVTIDRSILDAPLAGDDDGELSGVRVVAV